LILLFRTAPDRPGSDSGPVAYGPESNRKCESMNNFGDSGLNIDDERIAARRAALETGHRPLNA